MKTYYVYILASERNGTLYIGVTNSLHRRIFEHRKGILEGFTKRYNVKQLVWYESFDSIEEALRAEKRMKNWRREYKLNSIEERNPEWKDLYNEIIA